MLSSGSRGERSVQRPGELLAGRAVSPLPVPLLTSNTWAKSAATSSSRCTVTGFACEFLSVSSSTRLPASQRRRTSSTSARSSRGPSSRLAADASTVLVTRETTTADSGVGVLAASSSTCPPVTLIRRRLRWRTSSYTKPWVGAAMSPPSPLIAKLRPSTVTRSCRPPAGTVSAKRCSSDIRPLCTTPPPMHIAGIDDPRVRLARRPVGTSSAREHGACAGRG